MPNLLRHEGGDVESPRPPSTLSAFRTCTLLGLENFRKECWPNTPRTCVSPTPQVWGCSPLLRLGFRALVLVVYVVATRPMSPTCPVPKLRLSTPVLLATPGPASPDLLATPLRHPIARCLATSSLFCRFLVVGLGTAQRTLASNACLVLNGNILPITESTAPSQIYWPSPSTRPNTFHARYSPILSDQLRATPLQQSN